MKHFFPALIFLTLWGCVALKPSPPLPPSLPIPSSFEFKLSTSPLEAQKLGKWWMLFNDPELNELIEENLLQNPSLQEAFARIRASRAMMKSEKARLFPTLQGKASFTEKKVDHSEESLYEIGFDASWEVDLLIKENPFLKAKEAEIQIEEENLHESLVSLSGEVVKNYLQLRTLQAKLKLIDERLEDCEKEYERILSYRHKAGLMDSKELERARQALSSIYEQRESLKKEIKIIKSALCVLLGKPPQSLEDKLETFKPIPLPPKEVMLTTPLEVLKLRPDLRRAQKEILKEESYLKAKRLESLPTFKLLSAISVGGLTLGDLLTSPKLTLQIGASLSKLLFDGGSLKWEIEAQEAQFQGALARYEKTLLQALKEVQEALFMIETNSKNLELIQESLKSAEKIFEMEKSLYESGLIDKLTLIEAKKNLYDLQMELLEKKGELGISYVSLYKALGGGLGLLEEKDGRKNES